MNAIIEKCYTPDDVRAVIAEVHEAFQTLYDNTPPNNDETDVLYGMVLGIELIQNLLGGKPMQNPMKGTTNDIREVPGR